MRAAATQADSPARVSLPASCRLRSPKGQTDCGDVPGGDEVRVVLPRASCRASPAACSARPASLAAGVARLTRATPRQVVVLAFLVVFPLPEGGCAMQRRPAPSRLVRRSVLCRVFARGPVLRGATWRGRCLWRSLGQVGARIGTPRFSTAARRDSSKNDGLE